MISYFYQIRNFTKDMIPVSTAIWDPLWYHDFTRDYDYTFKDKRGILNGLRCLPIIECGRQSSGCHGPESCAYVGELPHCPFLSSYRQNLDTIDFNKLLSRMNLLEDIYKKENNIDKEITIVLIVYETPKNPCSERCALIDYFNSKGYDLKEFVPEKKTSI